MDLSYGDSQSVNYYCHKGQYDNEEYELTLPTLDNLLNDIIACNDDPKLIKLDIELAFRNVCIDPGDVMTLGLAFQGEFYIAFGVTHGTAIFQCISDAIRRFMAHEGHRVWNYIDDIFGCAEEQKAQHAFERLTQLVSELGLPINGKKLRMLR